MEREIAIPESWDTEEVLRALFKSLPIGVCITDEDGCFVHVNAAYGRIYGYEVDELIGASFLKVVPPANREILQKLHDDFLLGDENEQGVELPAIWEVVRRDGSHITIRATARRFASRDGKRYKVTTVTDISEQLRLERLREDAERIVRHDLKSPINGIVGGAQLLLADPDLDAAQREYAAMILESGQQMNLLINSSMDFYSMEEGSYQLKQSPFEIDALFKHLEKELAWLSNRRQQRLEFSLADGAPTLNGERRLIHDMLTNLIKNALEAAPESTTVRVDYHIDRHGHPSFTIHNRGAVPAQVRERLFDRYVSCKPGGTGLGTYSASLIARAHGGEIHFTTSDEDDCTTFTVTLPPALLEAPG